MNIHLSPIICHEQPLSRYHDRRILLTIKDICNRNNLFLRYTNLFGSFCDSYKGISCTFLRLISTPGCHMFSLTIEIIDIGVLILNMYLPIISISGFV